MTIPWVIASMHGWVPLDASGNASYINIADWPSTHCFKTGVSFQKAIPQNAKIMLMTTALYLVIQVSIAYKICDARSVVTPMATPEAAVVAVNATPVGSVSAMSGRCTRDDYQIIDQKGSGNRVGSMPQIAAQCSTDSWSFWCGFKVDDATRFIVHRTSLSHACASCYGNAGQYGYSNCKSKCLWSWCSRGCLDCVKPYESTVTACLGRTSPKADYCR